MKSEKLHIEIVTEACDRCFPVEIWIQHSLGTSKYAGSLLPIEKSGDSNTIKASVTVPEDEGPDLSKGAEVRAFFLNAGGIYSFQSHVRNWAPYKDAKEKGVVTLSFPGEIKLAQRRNFFRVPLPSNNRASIDVKVKFRDETHVVKGKIKDLSGGGIALRTVKSPMNFFELDTRVELDFCLPRRTERIKLNAIVTRRADEDSHYFYGMKFMDHFRTPESRGFINLILQYIFAFERLMLKI